jgi:hypothetical protein
MAGLITTYGDKTSSNTTSYPDYITGLMTKGFGALDGASSGLLSGLSGYKGGVAPWNANLAGAFAGAGNLGKNNTDWSGQIAGSGQVGAGDIQPLMDPYAKAVGNDTIQAISDSYDNADAQAAAQAASGAAFPGSGSGLALQRAQMARSEAQDKESAMNGLLSQAYNSASGLAEGNASRGQSGLIAADNATSNNQNRTMDALNGLLSTGQIRQSFDQSNIDQPWSNFTRFMGMLPGAPTTQTQNDPQTIDWLSVIGALGSKAFGF